MSRPSLLPVVAGLLVVTLGLMAVTVISRARAHRTDKPLRLASALQQAPPLATPQPPSPSATPIGRFSITDKLSGGAYGPYYGCCILALSGHQTNTPAGWRGGDRLAIHGTNDPSSIGTGSSAGCLHARARDLHVLMRRVPL